LQGMERLRLSVIRTLWPLLIVYETGLMTQDVSGGRHKQQVGRMLKK